MSTNTGKNYQRSAAGRRAAMLLGATALALGLSWVPGAALITYPLRLLSTIAHESGHAIATLVTGGSVLNIWIRQDGSGVTESAGGWPAVIYMAGYIGAAIIGGALLLVAGRSNKAKTALGAVGVLVAVAAAFWIHPWSNPFGFGAAIFDALVILAASRLMTERAARFTLAFVATQISLNAVSDLRTLFYLTTATQGDNDAVFMSRAYGLPPAFWAGLWAAIAFIIFVAMVRVYITGARAANRSGAAAPA